MKLNHAYYGSVKGTFEERKSKSLTLIYFEKIQFSTCIFHSILRPYNRKLIK